ncbi:hypothetical protein D5085_09940 [Ectothiorhodospiraceae bacterium BW-2]|nr:hypothetical protein D5085_09940 [Ectothiorhodospiraceae bacterium BW-2]
MPQMSDIYQLESLIEQTRQLAAEYKLTTGKPLPVTSEIATHDAIKQLHLQPVPLGTGGYDAIGTDGPRQGVRYQIKGRAIFDENRKGQRIGQLKIEQSWDAVLLVLLDETFHPVSIYEATREEVEQALEQALKSRRTSRGAMSVARFKMISRLVWSSDEGLIDDEIWFNHPESPV